VGIEHRSDVDFPYFFLERPSLLKASLASFLSEFLITFQKLALKSVPLPLVEVTTSLVNDILYWLASADAERNATDAVSINLFIGEIPQKN
jgi:hypothetical protein